MEISSFARRKEVGFPQLLEKLLTEFVAYASHRCPLRHSPLFLATFLLFVGGELEAHLFRFHRGAPDPTAGDPPQQLPISSTN